MKNFWEPDNLNKSDIALLDKAHTFTYKQCLNDSQMIAHFLEASSSRKELAFIFCSNNYQSIMYYFACLNSGIAVLLLDIKLNDELGSVLIEKYKPKFIFTGEEKRFNNYNDVKIGKDFSVQIASSVLEYSVHKDLAVLLSTSGTTGSPKAVKLSYRNIQSNAESIAEYLHIKQDDRSITSLPMSYSFGLSIINSYLLSGASVFLTSENLVLRNFWDSFKQHKCTSFSGVPYSYLLLRKTNFEKLDLPHLRTMTQAGGRLSTDLIEYYHKLSQDKNFNFYVMYGQTEATARISYVPAKKLGEKIGSIGIAIPGGKLEVMDEAGNLLKSNMNGEIVYSGGNVMMGYAESFSDLADGDILKGVLRTGDLGYKDDDGYFFITGRSKRFIKISGLRVNLDEVEKMIENHFNTFNTCVGEDDNLKVLIQGEESDCANIFKSIIEYLKIPKSSVMVKAVEKIPVTLSGKKDYNQVRDLI